MGSSPTAEPAKARMSAGDRRAERSRRAVLTTTLELLEESGVGGFSVDEVVRRSGVAKTTIYRHWATREALVLDACARISDEPEVPNTGSLAGDLRDYLVTMGTLLQTANWSTVLPSIVDAAERDSDFAAVHAEIQRAHAAPLRQIIDRAITRGELPRTTDPETMVATVLGPLFYRRWFSRQPLDDAFLDALLWQSTVGS